MGRVNQRNDAIQREFSSNFIIHEKRLRHRTGISEASGFHQDVIKFVTAFHQVAEHSDQIASNRATDTTIGHFKNFFIRIDDKSLINANFTVLIFDHSNSFAVLFT